MHPDGRRGALAEGLTPSCSEAILQACFRHAADRSLGDVGQKLQELLGLQVRGHAQLDVTRYISRIGHDSPFFGMGRIDKYILYTKTTVQNWHSQLTSANFIVYTLLGKGGTRPHGGLLCQKILQILFLT